MARFPSARSLAPPSAGLAVPLAPPFSGFAAPIAAPSSRLAPALAPALAVALLAACATPSATGGAGTGGGAPASAAGAPAASVAPPAAAPAPAASAPPAPSGSPMPAKLDYPPAPREDVVDVLHGVPVADPYRWLEDVASPRTQAWVKAEDDLTRALLARLPERAPIAARLKELLYVEQVVGLPVKRGGRLFYQRRSPAQEKAVLYWRQGEGPEKVLLDPNDWSKDGSRSLGGWSPSWDGRRVAFQVKENNSDEAVLQLVEVDTGNGSAIDRIEGAKYAHPSWTPDSTGFYYTWLPTDARIPVAERPGFAEIRHHRVGTPAKDDPTVFPRTGDPRTFLSGEVSRDGRWIVVTKSFGWTSNDVFFREARADGPWRPLVVGRKAQFDVTPWKDRFYVRTNDGAPMWKVMAADPAAPDPGRWTTLVPERPDAALEGLGVVGGRLALNYTWKATSRLEVRDLDGTAGYPVALPGPGTATGPAGDPEEPEGFYAFQSFTEPREIRSLDLPGGATRSWYRTRVPVDPAPYVVEQVLYPSRDGTQVSMFVVRRRDQRLDGSAPLWLTGYGGFQVAMLPAFRGSIYPWLERGGIFAMPNLRGGSEYGERWHEAGMLLRKQNVFDDFVAAAEWLVANGYTRPERLAISGGSNGGLLVGAAMTQRPELFRVVVCAVPLLDMVRYHLFGSGKTWISEYGSADDAEQLRALLAYSPYHHVAKGTRYPATLLLTADSDDRVDPLHARKLAAALQWASTGGPVLLRVERQAGHGGADLVRQKVEEISDEYAFALDRIRGGAAR